MKKISPNEEEMMYIELYGIKEKLKDSIKTIDKYLKKLPLPYDFKKGKK